jgi:hypothetical protein
MPHKKLLAPLQEAGFLPLLIALLCFTAMLDIAHITSCLEYFHLIYKLARAGRAAHVHWRRTGGPHISNFRLL